MEKKEFNLNGIFYNENNEFIPLTARNGNTNGNLSHLRNTYLEAEKSYFEKILEDEEIRNSFYSFINYDSEKLFKYAMEIQYNLETGAIETKEQLEQMKLLTPEQRDMEHIANTSNNPSAFRTFQDLLACISHKRSLSIWAKQRRSISSERMQY